VRVRKEKRGSQGLQKGKKKGAVFQSLKKPKKTTTGIAQADLVMFGGTNDLQEGGIRGGGFLRQTIESIPKA